MCGPGASVEDVNDALPLTSMAVPIVVGPSVSVTVPVGVPASVDVTVAVIVRLAL